MSRTRPRFRSTLALFAPILFASLLAGSARADAGRNVVRAALSFPDLTPAAGAVATLSAPDPTQPVAVGTATADAAGTVSITVPPTAELVARARESADLTLALVLDAEAERSSAGGTDYYRSVETLTVQLVDAPTGAFFLDAVAHSTVLDSVNDFDALAAATAGLRTLAEETSWIADTSEPLVAQAIAEFDKARSDHDLSTDNPVVAYNVATSEGTMVYVTDTPQSLVLDPVDVNVFEVVPIGASAPAQDTTQIYDETKPVFDALRPIASPAQSEDGPPRGQWGKNNSDCFNVTGPKENPRYMRNVCWEIDFQNGDSNKTDSFWQYELDAQGTSINGYEMGRLWVEAKPNAGHTAPMQFDGLAVPESTNERAEPCNTKTETFTMQSGEPVQVGWSWPWDKVTCETYGPKIYSDPAHYASIWEPPGRIKAGVARVVKMGMPLRSKTKDGGIWFTNLTGQWTYTP